MHEALSDSQIINLIKGNLENTSFANTRKALAQELVRRFFENEYIREEIEAYLQNNNKDTR